MCRISHLDSLSLSCVSWGSPYSTVVVGQRKTQTRVDDDTWQRKTSAFFGLIDIPSSDYLLKRIITGNGSEGSWFNRGWLDYKNGSKLSVGYTVFPA
jgi:hypothetical protein